MRNIARFTGASVTGITINQYQARVCVCMVFYVCVCVCVLFSHCVVLKGLPK
jgi:hypothetical protein